MAGNQSGFYGSDNAGCVVFSCSITSVKLFLVTQFTCEKDFSFTDMLMGFQKGKKSVNLDCSTLLMLEFAFRYDLSQFHVTATAITVVVIPTKTHYCFLVFPLQLSNSINEVAYLGIAFICEVSFTCSEQKETHHHASR